MRDQDDDYEDFEDEPRFPMTVTLAGIGWILFGSLVLVNLAIVFAVLGGAMADIRINQGPGREGMASALACVTPLMAIFGAAFIFVGVQSVRGTARDTLGNGIGSIIFGLVNVGRVVGMIRSGRNDLVDTTLSVLVAIGLIGAGVLALVGRSEYKAWRKARKGTKGDKNP